MKRKAFSLAMAVVFIAIWQVGSFAQTTGSISGTVVDQTGAVLPGGYRRYFE